MKPKNLPATTSVRIREETARGLISYGRLHSMSIADVIEMLVAESSLPDQITIDVKPAAMRGVRK